MRTNNKCWCTSSNRNIHNGKPPRIWSNDCQTVVLCIVYRVGLPAATAAAERRCLAAVDSAALTQPYAQPKEFPSAFDSRVLCLPLHFIFDVCVINKQVYLVLKCKYNRVGWTDSRSLSLCTPARRLIPIQRFHSTWTEIIEREMNIFPLTPQSPTSTSVCANLPRQTTRILTHSLLCQSGSLSNWLLNKTRTDSFANFEQTFSKVLHLLQEICLHNWYKMKGNTKYVMV